MIFKTHPRDIGSSTGRGVCVGGLLLMRFEIKTLISCYSGYLETFTDICAAMFVKVCVCVSEKREREREKYLYMFVLDKCPSLGQSLAGRLASVSLQYNKLLWSVELCLHIQQIHSQTLIPLTPFLFQYVVSPHALAVKNGESNSSITNTSCLS